MRGETFPQPDAQRGGSGVLLIKMANQAAGAGLGAPLEGDGHAVIAVRGATFPPTGLIITPAQAKATP